MKILFNDLKRANLPEIEEYCSFFSEHGFKVAKTSEVSIEEYSPRVFWDFMGFNLSRAPKNVFYIQEYLSGSTGRLKTWKNCLKSKLNTKPDLRIFLNPYVMGSFTFNDDIPWLFRDMGVSLKFFQAHPKKKSGIVCVTNQASNRILRKFIKNNLELFSIYKMDIIGDYPEKLKIPNANIRYLGRIPYSQIPKTIINYEFGLILYEDIEPYRHQTSTRLLEFAAANLKIIATPLPWINHFFKDRNGHFLTIRSDYSINNKMFSDFNFKTPSVHDLSWPKQIQKSGILQLLNEIK